MSAYLKYWIWIRAYRWKTLIVMSLKVHSQLHIYAQLLLPLRGAFNLLPIHAQPPLPYRQLCCRQGPPTGIAYQNHPPELIRQNAAAVSHAPFSGFPWI